MTKTVDHWSNYIIAIMICTMNEKYSAMKLLIQGSESFWEALHPPENDKYIEMKDKKE